jgi:hypothetical protein
VWPGCGGCASPAFFIADDADDFGESRKASDQDALADRIPRGTPAARTFVDHRDERRPFVVRRRKARPASIGMPIVAK